MRYHSLTVGELPAALHAPAWTADGVLMGLAHLDAAAVGRAVPPGVDLHRARRALLRNFRDLALAPRRGPSARRARAAPARAPPASLVHPARSRRWRDAEAVFVAFYGEREVAFWLDSSRADRAAGASRSWATTAARSRSC